jgi:AraC-like DNA-binding protein
MWVPISLSAMRHVIAQAVGPVPLPDTVVEKLTKSFLVPDSSVFHFSAKRRVIGDMTVTLTTQSGFRFSGSPSESMENIHIGFVLNGCANIGSGGRPTEAFHPVSTYAVASWESAEVESTTMTRGLDIQLPLSVLEERSVRLRGDRSRIDSGSLATPLLMLARSTVDTAWAPSEVGTVVTQRVIEDLVVGMFLESEGYAMDSEDLRAGLRSRAISEIGAKHRNGELTPAVVATRLGVSLRHLQRAFEGSGTSLTRQISRSRAETAALLLSAPRQTELTISEIATRSGFASTFELRAAFRSRYGVLPSDYRVLPIEQVAISAPQGV